ncbi:MAG: tail fiber domain-containing protein [Phycisphaerales bacterium]|nr:tail fiber domain-containing protein [Phycisphaerales bacterium]
MMIRMWSACLIAAASVTTALAGGPSDTEFTYQGELRSAGAPANGAFDLTFSLWDAVAGGTPVVGPVVMSDVPVSGGVFSVELDFGAAAFDGTARWLEIAVDGTTLSPRQAVTGAPYSIQTRGLFVDEDLDVGIGTTAPMADLHVFGSQATLRLEHAAGSSYSDFKDATTQQLRINKTNLAGGVLLDLNPKAEDGASSAQIRFFRETNTTGPKSVQFLRGNFTTQASAVIGVDGADSYFQAHGGNVGVGTSDPQATFHVVGSSQFIVNTTGSAIFALNYGGVPGHGIRGDTESTAGAGVRGWAKATSGATHGVWGESSSTAGTGVQGFASATTGITVGVGGTVYSGNGRGVSGEAIALGGVTYGVYGQSDSPAGRGVSGVATSTSGTCYGVIGQCNSTAGYDFYAAGAGVNYGAGSSRRWKHNVENLADPLAMLGRLRGVSFDWDVEHGGHHDVGMIAEEVGAVLPEIVVYEANGVDAIGMDYSKLTPLLVEAVNALRAENDALRDEKDAENRELRRRIAELERTVATLIRIHEETRP